jgi:hypothetical protein
MRVICRHITYLTVRSVTVLITTGAITYLIITTDTPLMSLSSSGRLRTRVLHLYARLTYIRRFYNGCDGQGAACTINSIVHHFSKG